MATLGDLSIESDLSELISDLSVLNETIGNEISFQFILKSQ